MTRWAGLGAAALACLAGGCVTTPAGRTGVSAPPAAAAEESMLGRLSAAVGDLGRSLRPARGAEGPVPWDWATAIPQGTTRAELVRPAVPAEAVAAAGLAIPDQGVTFAAGGGGPRPLEIAAVGPKDVKDYGQLNAAAAAAGGKPVPVRVRAGADAPTAAGEVKPEALHALCLAATPDGCRIRVTEDGNPWVVLRQGAVRAKVMARAERRHGLLQVALALDVGAGPPAHLPVDVRARCDGKPLACLTVADTLERLYGDPSAAGPAGPAAQSFAAVSEREEYLVPSNYKRLQQKAEESSALKPMVPPLPALATLPGVPYPGPAMLGDARALCGFLLQRQPLQPGEPGRVGWVMFGGDALRTGRAVTLAVDLGSGPVELTFEIPAQ